ncbi:MAG: hypothetical protein Ct9H90mP30_0530 [Actinomycetota bacterium]|nr:MAG: hypothetical protein Ct9H90mP30_0530 [Actinomycetota bacterium]
MQYVPLTHDNKFDVPAITSALKNTGWLHRSNGKREKTHENRTERLIEAGVTTTEFERVMSPIGLDLGARTPEETAISICAEIIAMRTGRKAPPPKGTIEGAIHGDR